VTATDRTALVSAPLLTNLIPINLPRTEAVAPVKQKDPLVVSVDGSGKLFINKDEIQQRAVRKWPVNPRHSA
jgi:biopolymer transport protein TolR